MPAPRGYTVVVSEIADRLRPWVDLHITDPEEAKAAKADLVVQLLERDRGEVEAAFQAYERARDASGRRGRWMVWTWRPVMMFTFILILLQYYVIFPITTLVWPRYQPPTIPAEMWTLLSVAIGGAVLSRGAEKGISVWKGRVDVEDEPAYGPGPAAQAPGPAAGAAGGEETEEEEEAI